LRELLKQIHTHAPLIVDGATPPPPPPPRPPGAVSVAGARQQLAPQAALLGWVEGCCARRLAEGEPPKAAAKLLHVLYEELGLLEDEAVLEWCVAPPLPPAQLPPNAPPPPNATPPRSPPRHATQREGGCVEVCRYEGCQEAGVRAAVAPIIEWLQQSDDSSSSSSDGEEKR
jgi:hypothetical protein